MTSTDSQIQVVETEMRRFQRRYPDYVGYQPRWIDAYFTLRERLNEAEKTEKVV